MVRISHKEEITYNDRTQTQKPDKELLEQFEQLREILRNFNQNLFQIQTWETPRTKRIQGPQEKVQNQSAMPARLSETSAMKGMPP